MGHAFYGFGVLVLMSVILSLSRFNRLYKTREWLVKFKRVTGNEPSIIDFRSRKDHTLYNNHNALLMIELVWVLLGLITGSWYMFLSVIVLGLILNFTFGKIKFTMIGKIISFKFVLYRALLYSFLILNHFWLHIDVWNLLMKAS